MRVLIRPAVANSEAIMLAKLVKQLRSAQATAQQIERRNEHIALSMLRDEYRRRYWLRRGTKNPVG